MAKIIITGSNGFIGKRLIYELLQNNHEIYALTRIKGIEIKISDNPLFHTIYGDVSDPSTLHSFPKNVDAVYYLIHSMGSVIQNLVETEKKIAHNFITAIERTTCKQIIFLGGIIEDPSTLSSHLKSRLFVEKILQSSRIPCTILRSSIIIGSGSASFEIIRDLVEKLPIIIAPKWAGNYCQPIAIRDILFYLDQVLLKSVCFGETYDLGGPEAISFKQVLLRYAKFRKLKRYIFNIPMLTPKISSYWMGLITSVRFSICSYLVESMKQNTRKINKSIDKIIPHKCLSYEKSLELAFQRIAQNAVVSTWMDAWDIEVTEKSIQPFIEVPQEGCLRDNQVIPITIHLEEVCQRVWSIGGRRGWYTMNWAWSLRGFIDKLFGGIGLNRGRRNEHTVDAGDSIDFWRVLIADKEKGHLILYADMKLPGEAWLEFQINRKDKKLQQTATFRPKGFWGRLYWYMSLPLHYLLFKKMAKNLAQKNDL